jgi:hypothetical protein
MMQKKKKKKGRLESTFFQVQRWSVTHLLNYGMDENQRQSSNLDPITPLRN